VAAILRPRVGFRQHGVQFCFSLVCHFCECDGVVVELLLTKLMSLISKSFAVPAHLFGGLGYEPL
jgi:hypothetical protein